MAPVLLQTTRGDVCLCAPRSMRLAFSRKSDMVAFVLGT